MLHTDFTCVKCRRQFSVPTCMVRWRREHGVGDPRWCSAACRYGKSESMGCATCGARVIRHFHRLAPGKQQFCSTKCSGIAKRTGMTILCAGCSAPVYVVENRRRRYRAFFCNNRCRLSSQFSSMATEAFRPPPRAYRLMVDRIRKSPVVSAWKKAVAERDVCCKGCGGTTALQAHHLYPLNRILAEHLYDEVAVLADPRLGDPRNGQLLCSDCHSRHHLASKGTHHAHQGSSRGR